MPAFRPEQQQLLRLVLPGGLRENSARRPVKQLLCAPRTPPTSPTVQIPHAAASAPAQGPTAAHGARSRAPTAAKTTPKGAEIASIVDAGAADLFDMKGPGKSDAIARAAAVHVLLAIRAARVIHTRGDRARRVSRPPPHPFRRRKSPSPPAATLEGCEQKKRE